MTRLLVAACVALCLFPCRSMAQIVTATMTGVVRDPSGAPIPETRIRVLNAVTNLVRETTSDASGSYLIPALPPGPYRVEAERQGFKTAQVTGIVLEVAQRARVDLRLELGQVTETLSVHATVPLLETESPQIGNLIDRERIVNLPLNGRNFMELTLLSGGINEAQGGGAKGGSFNKGLAPSAAGMPAEYNVYQLDGVDNREGFNHSYNLAPSVDAVREFRMQIGQYSAEFGGGGAVINVVTRSGTNEFHGAAWEFVRNNVFDARNFFLQPNQTIAPLRRNQFGVAAGGPILLPKIYNGKNRTFVFGNFELNRVRRGLFRTAAVPSTTQRTGDLSSLGKALTDPTSGQPFPNAVIPGNRLNPISAGIAGFYPQPNNPATPLQNYQLNISSRDDFDAYLVRFDHRLSEKHDLMGRYGIQSVDRITPGTFANVGGTVQPQQFHGLVVGLTSSFTPTFLNEARFNFIRSESKLRGQNTGNPIAANLGMPFAPRVGFDTGFPQTIGLARTSISAIGEPQPTFITVDTFQWYDGITLIRGGHTLKFGADYRRARTDINIGIHSNGNYTFSGQFTGDGFADFLLGIPASSLLKLAPNQPGDFQMQHTFLYAQDDWRISPRLTLNLGLRYEYNSSPREVLGFTPLFDPAIGGLRFPSHNTTAEAWYREFRPDLPLGKLDRETIFRPDRNNFAPRVGLAWRPLGSNATVIRSGFGFYYGASQISNFAQNGLTGPPAQLWPTYASDPVRPTLSYAGQAGVPVEQALKSATFGVLSPVESKYLDSYTMQWSLSLGQSIGQSFVLEAQYLGSRTNHAENLFDYNWAPPAASPLANRIPFPKWGRVAGFSSGASATYHALLLSAEKRLSHGLTFRTSYTLSKTLTYGGGRIQSSNLAVPQYPGNLRLESGYSTDHMPHRFVGNFTYELPIGKGKALGAGWSGVTDAILGGWQFAGIFTARTGFYLNSSIAAANCNIAFFMTCRPDRLRDPFLGGSGLNSPRWDRAAFDWPLNTAVHPAQPQRIGNTPPNALQGNGIFNGDLSLLKSFHVNERMRFEFRFESFNAFNHANFANPNTSVENPQFGRVFSTQTDPRVNQLGLKFYW